MKCVVFGWLCFQVDFFSVDFTLTILLNISRWFDKSFSLIVTKDGVSGINFEHSWGDGVAVLRFFQDIYNETTTNPFVHPDTKPLDTNRSVRKLGKYCGNCLHNYDLLILLQNLVENNILNSMLSQLS